MNNREAIPETEFVVEPKQPTMAVNANKMDLKNKHIPLIMIYNMQFSK